MGASLHSSQICSEFRGSRGTQALVEKHESSQRVGVRCVGDARVCACACACVCGGGHLAGPGGLVVGLQVLVVVVKLGLLVLLLLQGHQVGVLLLQLPLQPL